MKWKIDNFSTGKRTVTGERDEISTFVQRRLYQLESADAGDARSEGVGDVLSRPIHRRSVERIRSDEIHVDRRRRRRRNDRRTKGNVERVERTNVFLLLLQFPLREEERLAATLWKIEQDAVIIPRGAYVLQPTGDVQRNRTFEGLTPTESGKLTNYFHFRPPIRLEQKSFLYRATLDKSVHFLDSIDEDVPKGKTTTPSERKKKISSSRL